MKPISAIYLIVALLINAYTGVSLFSGVSVTNGNPPFPTNNQQQPQPQQQQTQPDQTTHTQMSKSQIDAFASQVMGDNKNNAAVLALIGLRALINIGINLNVDISFGADHKYLDLTTGAILSWDDLSVECPTNVNIPAENTQQTSNQNTQTSIDAQLNADINASSDDSLFVGSSLGDNPAPSNKPPIRSPWAIGK